MIMKKAFSKITPYFYIAPLLMIYLIFLIYPIVRVAIDSFYKYEILVGTRSFIGLENYRLLINDKVFLLASRNNLIYLGGLLIFLVPSAIIIAFLLNRNDLKGQKIFNTIYLIPYVLPMVGVGILFRMILRYEYGLITKFLDVVGLSFLKDNWLIQYPDAIIIIIFITIWIYFGGDTIFLYASMQQIPKEIYEAAELDGVNNWQKLIKITIPMIKDMITVVVGSNIIGGLTQFALFYVVISKSPPPNLQVMATWIITQAFNYDNMGYGAALSLTLLILVMLITFLFIFIRQRGDNGR